MSLIREVISELVSMFVGDARLSLAVLVVVALAAVLIKLAGLDPVLAGGVLLVGCLMVLLGAVGYAARHQ